jgi:biotin carboxyl carrier protein
MGRTLGTDAPMKYLTTINGTTFDIEIQNDGTLLVNGEKRAVDFLSFGDEALYSIIMDTVSHELLIDERDGEYEILMRGKLYTGTVLDERAQLVASRGSSKMVDSGEISIRAPMPGLIVAVPVQEGQVVKAGQTVVILESMKMQNELKSPRDGIVQRISVESDQSVEQNKLLVTIT